MPLHSHPPQVKEKKLLGRLIVSVRLPPPKLVEESHLKPGDRRDVSYKIAQSAEGATQPSPDREVGLQVGMKGSREGLTKLHLIENILGIKIHAVSLQQGNKLVFKRFLPVACFLLVDVPNHRGHIR